MLNHFFPHRTIAGQLSTLLLSAIVLITGTPSLSGAGETKDTKPAPATKPAGFPVVQLTYSHSVKTIDLIADYGYIIDWYNRDYYVFNKVKRTRIRTITWEHFAEELRKLPDGVEIDGVSRCTAPFSYGMPEENWGRLRRLFAEKKFKTINWDGDNRHTHFCYYESKRLTVLWDAAS